MHVSLFLFHYVFLVKYLVLKHSPVKFAIESNNLQNTICSYINEKIEKFKYLIGNGKWNFECTFYLIHRQMPGGNVKFSAVHNK